jgi:hypothetical protein
MLEDLNQNEQQRGVNQGKVKCCGYSEAIQNRKVGISSCRRPKCSSVKANHSAGHCCLQAPNHSLPTESRESGRSRASEKHGRSAFIASFTSNLNNSKQSTPANIFVPSSFRPISLIYAIYMKAHVLLKPLTCTLAATLWIDTRDTLAGTIPACTPKVTSSFDCCFLYIPPVSKKFFRDTQVSTALVECGSTSQCSIGDSVDFYHQASDAISMVINVSLGLAMITFNLRGAAGEVFSFRVTSHFLRS